MRAPLLASAFLVLAACGGGGAKPEVPTVALPSDGGVAVAPPPAGTGLEGARTPPPLELGSKHASRKAHPEWAACRTSTKPAAAAGDEVRASTALGTACGPGMATALAFAGKQEQTQGAQAFPFKAEPGRCYRVVAAAAPGVRTLVVSVVDAEGQIAGEWAENADSPLLAPPEAVCFSHAQDAKVTVSIGWGSGPFAGRLLSSP
jgi:hypothetical protein